MGLNSPLQSQFTIFIILLAIFSSSTTLTFASNLPIAKPQCQDTCGNITIPFPFGTQENCYLSEEFVVTCNNDNILYFGNIPVISISLEGQLWISKNIAYVCYKSNGEINDDAGFQPFTMSRKSFKFNTSSNVFSVVGCDSYAFFNAFQYGKQKVSTGCISFCRSKEEITSNGSCTGAGCCQMEIPPGISDLNTSLSSLNNYSYIQDINNCVYAFIVEKNSFSFSLERITKGWDSNMLPAVLDWAIVDNNCGTAKVSSDYACKGISTYCQDYEKLKRYRCHCKPGYEGNPYLDGPGGCTDIDECKGSNKCKKNSVCQNTPGNYTCNCLPGFEGDGFLDDCKDIDECQHGNHTCPKESTNCINTYGSYQCKCKTGFKGAPNLKGIGCEDIDECSKQGICDWKKKSYCLNKVGNYTCECKKRYKADKAGNCKLDQQVFYQLIAGISVASLFIFLASTWLYFIYKKRRSIQKIEMMREKFFKENGGLLLMEKFSEQQSDRRAKIYLEHELEKATDNFSESRILGKGGYGIVFKGYLKGMSENEQQEIAVKKSKEMDRSQMETFANEVFLLSQINHKNVVRLLGCCLDTENPLLVYEFIDNGTLSEHIHDSTKASFLSLEIRLRIATETAEVLSYLHSAASPPIIHRDIKSANILLDKNYTAKVSDFGVSRLFPLDETQLPTVVLGTFGYLDPEYMQTGTLTVKSDVYSFGVLLMEIITGKKVVYFDRIGEERRLAKHFLSCLDENKLPEILDGNLLRQEEDYDLLVQVALVAKRCISIRGADRPSMREVATKLQGLLYEMKPMNFQDKPEGTRKMEPLLLEASMYDGFDGISISIDSGDTNHMSSLSLLGTADGR